MMKACVERYPWVRVDVGGLEVGRLRSQQAPLIEATVQASLRVDIEILSQQPTHPNLSLVVHLFHLFHATVQPHLLYHTSRFASDYQKYRHTVHCFLITTLNKSSTAMGDSRAQKLWEKLDFVVRGNEQDAILPG
ncbi:hypothetical protein N7535_007410 [Penicillium sp. DV-2018c]|nr:hypothetical protein N7535_007410 [Penicillium sp. DV-2018c]